MLRAFSEHPRAPCRLIDETRGTQEVRQTARIFNRIQRRLRRDRCPQHVPRRRVARPSHAADTHTLASRRVSSDPLIERCYPDINEMNALLDTILVYLREESDAEPRQRVDIYALAQSLVEDMTEAGHSIAFHGVPAVAYGQPKSLLRCLSNLLDNAVHYGKEPEVRVSIEGGRVFADVLDRGPGIPDNRLEQVIKPFFRLEPSRNRNSGGTGLGLHIVRELAERNGGQLEISNRPGGGLRAPPVHDAILSRSSRLRRSIVSISTQSLVLVIQTPRSLPLVAAIIRT